MGRLLHLVQRRGAWTGWGPAQPSPLLAVPNVTADPSTASVPTTILRYDGPLLCRFNLAIKGLRNWTCRVWNIVDRTGRLIMMYKVVDSLAAVPSCLSRLTHHGTPHLQVQDHFCLYISA